MSLFVLDTDTLTLLQLDHPQVKQRVEAHPPNDLAIAVISVEEQLSGWYSRIRQAKTPDDLARAYQRLADRVRDLGRVAILSFTKSAILRYESLKSQKLNVKKNDLRIAAIALEHGATVVTRNLRDFQRVPGLTVEDWSV